jgi:hypothetical protein
MLIVSPKLVCCCWSFNFRFEPSYVELVMFICGTFEILKIALYSSSVIYVIVNGMCVCMILDIWWSTYRDCRIWYYFWWMTCRYSWLRCGLTRGTLSGERVLALILMIMTGSSFKIMLNWTVLAPASWLEYCPLAIFHVPAFHIFWF